MKDKRRVILIICAIIGLISVIVDNVFFSSKHYHAQEAVLSDPTSLLNAKSQEKISLDSNSTEIAVSDYGNGVYYFPCNGAFFLKTLSKFLEAHTSLEVTAMTGGIARNFFGNSYAPGFYVICSKKHE